MEQFGAIALSSDILEKANIGLWAFELDEGKEPRMYADDTTLRLLGVRERLSPEETYHAWYDRVDSEHYDEVNEAVKKMTAGVHSEAQYPWHHPDGHTMIIRCGGVRNFSYLRGVRIEGCHQDVTQLLHIEKQKQEELSETIETITADYECLLHADFDSLQETHYRESKRFSEAIPGWARNTNYLERVYLLGNTLVIPEDRKAFLEAVNPYVVSEKVKDGVPYYVDFRVRLNGQVLWYQAKMVHHLQHAGHNCAIIGIMDNDEATHQRRQEQAVISSLGDDFDYIAYVDPDTMAEHIFRANPNILSLFPEWETIHSFQERLQAICDLLVHPDDREMFLRQTSREEILRRFETESVLFVNFRILHEGKTLYYQGKYVSVSIDGKIHVVVGFHSVDKEVRTQLENAEVVRQQLAVIQGLASDYKSVFYLDLAQNKLTPYRIRVSEGIDYSKIQPDSTPYPVAIARYIEQAVYASDREMVTRQCDTEYVRQELQAHGSLTITYRNDLGGVIRFCQMKFVRVDEGDGVPTACALGFSTQDEQITREFVDDRLRSEYASVYLADLEAKTYRNIRVSTLTGFETDQRGDYTELMLKYAAVISPEYRELWRRLAEPDFARQFLADNDRRELVYTIEGAQASWRRAVFHVVERRDGVPQVIILSFTAIDRDRAEKLELTAKIEQQQKELEEALAMAQAANRAKTTFLNNMSHDIRTPMNAIIGFASLAASHVENTELVKEYLNKVSQSSDHLLSLINDVLDMSRIESGKMTITEKEEYLPDIIHGIRNIVQADMGSKQLDLFIDTLDIQDEAIFCDRLRLNQVLLNIMSNAIKYTPAGGTITLRILETAVKPNGYASFQFRVKDTGIGMSPEFLTRIFEPFERVKSSTVSGIQGTGLGMAITKNIVDMMGGQISVTSEEGKGTEVVLDFDFRLSASMKEVETIPQLSGLNSLVVDNDVNSCVSVSKMLRDVGMRSQWCTSGHEAVIRSEEAIGQGDSFRVYVIDWMMPDMNGIETARRIRKVVGDQAPIIILTAYDWADIEEEAKEAGVTAFVNKPLFPSDLRSALKRCCGINEPDEAADAEEYDLSGKKLLLVEDNELNREIATDILQDEAGLIVETAEDGTVAVDILRKQGPDFVDCILMDIQMPYMNGYDATKAIRAMYPNRRIPIIALSANAFAEDKQKSLEAGMDDHIEKPIDVGHLFEAMSRFL